MKRSKHVSRIDISSSSSSDDDDDAAAATAYARVPSFYISKDSDEEEPTNHHCRGKPIPINQLQKSYKTPKEKQAQRTHKEKKRVIRGQLVYTAKRNFEKYTASLPESRANYINNWATGPQRYVFRVDPFKQIIFPLPAGERPKKKMKRDLSISPPSPPQIYHLLALKNEGFGARFFMGLGPMELFNVYRTSHTMRTALTTCLPRCLDYITQRLEAEAAVLERADHTKKMRVILSHSACLLIQSGEHLIPRLIYLVHCLYAFVRVHATSHVKFHTRSGYEELRADLCYVARCTSDGQWRVVPLAHTNVFMSKQLYRVHDKVESRLAHRYARSEDGVDDCDVTYFDHTDWINADLKPVTVASNTRFCTDQLLFIDAENASIRTVMPHMNMKQCEDEPLLIVSLDHDPVYACLYAPCGLIDLYELRLAVNRKMAVYTGIHKALIVDKQWPVKKQYSLWEDNRYEKFRVALAEFRDLMVPLLGAEQPEQKIEIGDDAIL